jgi:tetratricopeptide (TPR) repeat protein
MNVGGAGRRLSRASLALLLCLACQTPAEGPGAASAPGEPPVPDARAEALLARRALENGRALRMEERLEAAERALKRGLALRPDDVHLLRELAHVLAELDRSDEADALRARADALDPPPAPPPDVPLPVADGRSIVVLVPGTRGLRPEEPGRWPGDAVQRALERRIATRLPHASLLRADPGSVGEAARTLAERDAARALSLRIDRADCRFSVKDGAIAVVELRAAAASRGGEAAAPLRAKVVVEDPPSSDCEATALARALEQAFASDAWQRVARTPAAATGAVPSGERAWQGAARALFPGIGRRIALALRHGESLLRAGELGRALQAFEQAAELDPRDPEVLAQLEDTRRSVELAREIASRNRRAGDAGADAADDVRSDPDSIDPRLSPAQRAAAEVALERERRRRDDLLSALAVLDEDLRAPPPDALRSLRPSEIRTPDAFGPSLARRRARSPVEARTAYAPDGSVLARYYFASASGDPLLREEDTDGDGSPDRWIAYRDGARGEIFEDVQGRGHPDLRMVFADGGEPLTRIEIDSVGDERPDRVFRYRDGALEVEESDTDGDGRLDRFDRFDGDGHVDLREEDLDGDGEIDVRSVYRGGKLVRREISSPEHMPES